MAIDVNGLEPVERIVLAVDTSDPKRAQELAKIAGGSGAGMIKGGLEFWSKESFREFGKLAADNGLLWIGDPKLKDIPNTVARAAANFVNLSNPPVGITMHTTAGRAAMRAANAAVDGNAIIFGVTVLSSMEEDEVERIFGRGRLEQVLNLASMAVEAGIGGLVASPLEVGAIKRNPMMSSLITMIPGTRSSGVDHGDQRNVATPFEAIRDGADLLVIGRQITNAADPRGEFQRVADEIARGQEERDRLIREQEGLQ
jgi:orotidine-5'-phosphate decarboxylase